MRRPQVLRGGQARARRLGEAAQARTAAAIPARHIGRAIRQGLCNASRQTLFGERRAIYARLIAITSFDLRNWKLGAILNVIEPRLGCYLSSSACITRDRAAASPAVP